ncbi:MAG: B12-binding domain-containing radical SAM protein, partial [Clostridiales bacterium]|nr:B12-binding domain-containing radical SAM protein [Clostridiales bacterium]
MKKVILYYPKLTGEEDSQPLYRGLPLSILTLAAQFDEKEYHITVIDGRIESNPYDSVSKLLDDECICVGVSAITSYQLMDGMNFSRQVKESNPSISIVWGGWHPSLMPQQTIKSDFIDIIVTGQGEITFPQLVEKLARKGNINDIPNLFYKDDNHNIVSTGECFLKEIKAVKPIEHSYQYINIENYIQELWGNKRVIIGYESSRGCPWNCKFCSIGSVYKRRWNALTAEQTFNGVKYLYEKHSIDAVHFYDNNFFVDEKRAQDFSRFIKAENILVRWDGTTVVEQFANFSDEYIEGLKESGFFRVIVGVESGDEDVLQKMNKRHRNDQVLQLVEKCKRHNIMASLSFMVGFPWDPEKDFEETVRLIEKIKSIDPNTEILLFIFSPYLGTPLYDVALEYGMTFPDSLEGWSKYTY